MTRIDLDDYLDLIRGFIETAKSDSEATWELFTTLVVGLEGADKKAVWEGLTLGEQEFLKRLKAGNVQPRQLNLV